MPKRLPKKDPKKGKKKKLKGNGMEDMFPTSIVKPQRRLKDGVYSERLLKRLQQRIGKPYEGKDKLVFLNHPKHKNYFPRTLNTQSKVHARAMEKLKTWTRERNKKFRAGCVFRANLPVPPQIPPQVRWGVISTNFSGEYSGYEKGRGINDKKGLGFDKLVICKHKIGHGLFAVVAKNRLTVLTDRMYDDMLRPVYQMIDVGLIVPKRKMHLHYGKFYKDRYFSCMDFLGNRHEVQMLVADGYGAVSRVDLCGERVIEYWFPWGRNKVIREIKTHTGTNLAAFLMGNKEIRFYIWPKNDELQYGEHEYVGTCFPPFDIVQMEWFGSELLILTKDSKFMKVNLNANAVYGNVKAFSKKPRKFGFGVVYKPKLRAPYVNFQILNDTNKIIVACNKKNEIEALDLKNKTRDHICAPLQLDHKRGWALNPLGRVLICAGSERLRKAYAIDFASGELLNDFNVKGGKDGPIHLMKFINSQDVMCCTQKRVFRIQPTGAHTFTDKVAAHANFLDTGEFYRTSFSSMDYTNIDHDHRSYEFRPYRKATQIREHMSRRARLIQINHDIGTTLRIYDRDKEIKRYYKSIPQEFEDAALDEPQIYLEQSDVMKFKKSSKVLKKIPFYTHKDKSL